MPPSPPSGSIPPAGSVGEPSGGPPHLRARGVGKRYGEVVALEDATLEVARGERVALVGESGSGKTTLLRTFNRMVVPDAGAVEVDGEDLAGADPVALRRSVGYVQQEGGLLPHWTVLRNAALVPRLRGMRDARERAWAALERVGLDPEAFGERWPRELSGGERQRVALARAVAAGPGVVLLDEPFGALDAITRSEVQETFLELSRSLGVTVLLVTHDLGEAFRVANRVVVLRGGRILRSGTPDELRNAPPRGYVGRLLRRAGVA